MEQRLYLRKRSRRRRKQFSDSGFFSNREDPATYEEAAKFNCWKEAMDQEIEAIERNDTNWKQED